MRKLSTEEVKIKLKEIDPNAVMLGEYVNSTSKIKMKCKNCNNIYFKDYAHLRRGQTCKKCNLQKGFNQKRHTLQELKKRLKEINEDIEIIDREYVNNKQPLKCKCNKCQKILYKSWNVLSKGVGCEYCFNKIRGSSLRKTIEEIKLELIQNGTNLILLSKDYKNNKHPLLFSCKTCGNVFEKRYDDVKGGHGCSFCGVKKRSGKNHHNYNPNITEEERLERRDQNRLKPIRNEVFKRDGYRCKVCNKKGGVLNAHHLDGYSWAIKKRFDSSNLVTLCEGHHKEFHKIYGNRNNTKEQFEEYMKQHAQ